MRERWFILAELCKKIGAETVAEIGVSRGINASRWLDLCPEITKIYLVDLDNSVFDTGLFLNHGQKKISFIKKNSIEAAKDVPDGLDFVFIDADHGYQAVKDDIDAWLPKVRQGGIIAGHDYMKEHNKHSEVRLAVNAKFAEVNLEQDTLENGNIYVWWFRKGIVRAT